MIHIAILGAGRWGTHLIRNFLHQDRAQIQAIVDPHRDRLTQIATQFNLPPSIQRLTDGRSLWSPERSFPLDAIVVATPASTHFEIIQTALHQGLHVLAEKPLTLTVAEAEQLTALAQRQQRQLVIDHTYLFHPAVQVGRTLCPELGNVHYGYASRTHLGPVRPDVDVLWDLAIHDLAILHHWLGQDPLQVQAMGQQWLPQSPNLADLVWARLIYASGLQITLHWCWNNPDKQRRFVLVGDRGALIFDELAADPLVLQRGLFREVGGFPFVPSEMHREVIPFPPQEPLAQVCTHFLDCIATGQPSSLSNGTIATQLVNILVALTRSLQTEGKWVSLHRSSLGVQRWQRC